MTNPKIIVTVTNDLTHDQRVRKVCDSLMKQGYTPHLVGRKLFTSEPIERPYPTHRFKLIFTKGAVFYAEYNIRLFLFLLFKKYDRIHANDLDTLLGAYLGSRFRKKPLVYDSHEYFTEVPELQNNPSAKRIWERIEEWIFPNLKEVITVNKSIATLYEKKYGGKINVMRNIPEAKSSSVSGNPLKSRTELGLPEDKIILIVQGTGINMDRGNEELAEAMKHLEGFLLLIIGSGDVLPMLKEKVKTDGLEDRVMFKDKMPYEELKQYTASSDAGMSVDKDTNINYRFSLPNKLFDFIHAGIPSIVSNLPEVSGIVKEYKVGTVLSSHDPKIMAEEIRAYLTPLLDVKNAGSAPVLELEKGLATAAKECTWEQEAEVLNHIYTKTL